jgi:regulator of replication initiation timing
VSSSSRGGGSFSSVLSQPNLSIGGQKSLTRIFSRRARLSEMREAFQHLIECATDVIIENQALRNLLESRPFSDEEWGRPCSRRATRGA